MGRIVVIGGGILGLAVAARAAHAGHPVTVIEKEERLAAHQTGHNSGVVHAGPYYKPGSLKARMCTAGNASMVAFAREHGIPHAVTGKLIVAVEDRELPGLGELHRRAIANGVPCRLIGPDEVADFEPNVWALGALRVETTAIIDYPAVCRELARQAEEHGAEILLGTKVTGIATLPGGVVVEHTSGETRGDLLVNCGGLHADRIAALAGVEPDVRIVPFRGEYYELRLERRQLVRGLIYPVPDPALPFLGVHLTRMIDGSVHAGPNAVLALAREGYRWRDVDLRDLADSIGYPGLLRMASHHLGTGAREVARSLSKRLFASSLARLVPEIVADDLTRAGAGVRAQAVRRDGSLVDDFVIQRSEHQVHVLNAPSPAATSALEIAASILQAAGLNAAR
ncbi:L-2-hydroxyglutarate oxidase [Leifsonia sp. TF02-11]|uniref:L-2-hydroxyglutarate oxidase n=1 Tax=Leifsonia sp. TF02-11 TaxID=2815212 RepID=UPI001AA17E15|nr:L-2-hydroxyglutarate oxidase [Leifsonia sp. TF02-11]MBO1739148.1 L-2-hydroxyglutarate oxidase [Leifsonia sp. TF02-11]